MEPIIVMNEPATAAPAIFWSFSILVAIGSSGRGKTPVMNEPSTAELVPMSRLAGTTQRLTWGLGDECSQGRSLSRKLLDISLTTLK